MNRRELIQFAGISGLATLAGAPVTAAVQSRKKKQPFTYCLNMATIRGQNLGFIKELEVASAAGFRSVEIWINTYQTYLKNGGTYADARKRIGDLGLTIENAIGFAPWIVDDDAKRKDALEQLKTEMAQLKEIGCNRIAAPPMGATNLPLIDLNKAAERYRTILELGDSTGVVPHLELWGFSKNLCRLSEVMYVALQSSHPSARVLLDSYHIYKGQSDISTMPLINPLAVDIFHVNDVPPNLSPEKITDADRILPGDGVAPVKKELEILRHPDRPLIISLEIFNQELYKKDALYVCKTGLEKMKKITSGIA